MAAERELLDVGYIVKAHGLRGQVIVELTTDRRERLDPGSVLSTDRGELRVISAAAHQHRYIVTFDGITDRAGAERWRAVTLRARRLEIDDVMWIDQMFGASVVTVDGTERGVVVAVEQHPTSDLLVLDTGALVPLTFVTDVTAHERVVVDGPEGLFE